MAITFAGSTQGGKGSTSYSWDFSDGGGVPGASTEATVDVTYAAGGSFAVSLVVTDKTGAEASCSTTVTVQGGNTPPTLNSIDNKSVVDGHDLSFTVTATDDGLPINGTLRLTASNLPHSATFTDNGGGNGTFEWLGATPVGSTNTTFTASDGSLDDSEQITITVNASLPPPDIGLDNPQTDFKIMMNYELGMHCTGFEFA